MYKMQTNSDRGGGVVPRKKTLFLGIYSLPALCFYAVHLIEADDCLYKVLLFNQITR